ncbi:MAG: hypothetical protein AB1486_10950 [Planctomycetota bacterium]
MSITQIDSRNRAPLLMGLLFAALIIAGNMVFTEATRAYVTQNLRSPNGWPVRQALMYVAAFHDVGKNAYMDSEAFVRVQIFMNYALLTGFLVYLGFLRVMTANAVRLTFRLLAVMGFCYLGVLLFDRSSLGGQVSAIRWFQSAGLVMCAGAAVLNYVLVRHLMQAHPPRGRLRSFWFIAACVCFGAGLDRQFNLNSSLSASLQSVLNRFDIVNVQTSLGYSLARLTPLAVSLGVILVAAAYAGLLRRHYSGRHADWHKPFAFALLFMTAAACCKLLPDQVSVTPWLNQISGILVSAMSMLILATFSWTAVAMSRTHLISETLTAPAAVTIPESPCVHSAPPRHTVEESEELLIKH